MGYGCFSNPQYHAHDQTWNSDRVVHQRLAIPHLKVADPKLKKLVQNPFFVCDHIKIDIHFF